LTVNFQRCALYAETAPAQLCALDRAARLAYAWHMLEENPTINARRRVRLFKNGRNQALRIPREFELPGDEAIVSKEGDRLVIEPIRQKSLLALLATLSPLEEDFPPIPDLPTDPVEL
jgi:antitoxin VapB